MKLYMIWKYDATVDSDYVLYALTTKKRYAKEFIRTRKKGLFRYTVVEETEQKTIGYMSAHRTKVLNRYEYVTHKYDSRRNRYVEIKYRLISTYLEHTISNCEYDDNPIEGIVRMMTENIDVSTLLQLSNYINFRVNNKYSKAINCLGIEDVLTLGTMLRDGDMDELIRMIMNDPECDCSDVDNYSMIDAIVEKSLTVMDSLCISVNSYDIFISSYHELFD